VFAKVSAQSTGSVLRRAGITSTGTTTTTARHVTRPVCLGVFEGRAAQSVTQAAQVAVAGTMHQTAMSKELTNLLQDFPDPSIRC
jgi:hypothetical protein